MNMNNDTNQTIALGALGWEPLEIERIKTKAKLVFKLLNKMGSKSLADLFIYKNEITNYELRSIASFLCLPQPRTNSMKRSFMYDWASVWNSLPKEIRESKSFPCFKNKIAIHTFDIGS